jgi:hypothetical protein
VTEETTHRLPLGVDRSLAEPDGIEAVGIEPGPMRSGVFNRTAVAAPLS